MEKLKHLFRKCRGSHSSLIAVAARHAWHKCWGRNIVAGRRVVLRGVGNIHTVGLLQVGMSDTGFTHQYDVTYLNIRGELHFSSNYSIGKGCRFDIGRGAIAKFGRGYVNAQTTFIIANGLTVGDDSIISWGCQFIDEDFHCISYPGRKERPPSIEIGDHVWIGANAVVLKGTRIPSGCVVAAGSVVSSVFDKPNSLIGGNPARVIKENVEWSGRN